MLTPTRWALVTGVALAVVTVVGTVQILVTGNGGAAWVIVALAGVSSLSAFAAMRRSAGHDRDAEACEGHGRTRLRGDGKDPAAAR